MYSFNRARFHALAAACTEVVIYRRVEVLHLDSAHGTFLFAYLAAYAAVFAA